MEQAIAWVREMMNSTDRVPERIYALDRMTWEPVMEGPWLDLIREVDRDYKDFYRKEGKYADVKRVGYREVETDPGIGKWFGRAQQPREVDGE